MDRTGLESPGWRSIWEIPPADPEGAEIFHESADSYFVDAEALHVFREAARGKVVVSPTIIEGREAEAFFQIWVTNFVDCLDRARTVASSPGGFYKNKIGVIKRPVFDADRWDGSELFVVPEDPSN